MAENAPQKKSETAEREEAVLAFWKERRIFERSVEKEAPRGDFVFYDGPPFANGQPHYGHILASTIKDAIPRYRTMRGFRVRRQWGWDCHGLPVENLVEKELGFKTKREIEEYGIGPFNEAARISIMKDVADWKRIIPRMGRFADMDRDYKTMDAPYTESVWWALKELSRKGLLDKSFKAMHLCPHCGTTLSNFEVSQGYKDIADLAVTVKLELLDEPGTYLLAWTTTPWTLPGNMAAAVHPGLDYAVALKDGVRYIVAKDRLGVLGEGASIEKVLRGTELIGRSYTPPFSYYVSRNFDKKENAWKVYGAPYVSADEGTGIVHLAPAFGEDDLLLAKEQGIPVMHHVDRNGCFVPEVVDFAGMPVKPKVEHQSADIEIVKHLAHRGLLFAKEKLTHAYPHCWRCDTPLLNYASTSWFVSVPKIRARLVAENKKVGWVPPAVGAYRFGNWLEGAREWAISRSRFWGAPLPIWEAADGRRIIIGSKEELVSHIKRSGNRYIAMRHGQAETNERGIISAAADAPYRLTARGEEEVRAAAAALGKSTNIDFIYASPVRRTRESAQIAADVLGIPHEAIIYDDRLREYDFGDCEGKAMVEYRALYPESLEHFAKGPEGGETYTDVKRRVGAFLRELEAAHAGKNILIVSHGSPIWMMRAVCAGATKEETLALHKRYPSRAEVLELPYVPLPVNADFELDYHRPYIDEVALVDGSGTEYRRVPEVFDCWFESGAMPFASNHYPAKKEGFNPRRWFGLRPVGYPADFIAEGMDQTRGWFYSLIVLGVALFSRSPYKHVIVNGLVLAEDGQKMSKRLKNYPDPMDVVEACGADALRYYLLSSPVVRGEDLNFSFRGVQEVASKNIGRLANVLAFYQLYEDGTRRSQESAHVLDRWIIARFHELVRESTAGYERYELDAAVRPLALFIDDLSVWYLRRCRDRIKDGGADAGAALSTLRFALHGVALVSAPSMPFFADHLYRAVREESDPESVHLASWPVSGSIDEKLIGAMRAARGIVSAALELREKAGIRVRQPLSSLAVPASMLPSSDAGTLLSVIADEVNVKEVVEGPSLFLDTTVTPALKEDGFVRELVRAVQGARKGGGLEPRDRIRLSISAPEAARGVIERRASEVRRATGAESISYETSALPPQDIGGYAIALSVERV